MTAYSLRLLVTLMALGVVVASLVLLAIYLAPYLDQLRSVAP